MAGGSGRHRNTATSGTADRIDPSGFARDGPRRHSLHSARVPYYDHSRDRPSLQRYRDRKHPRKGCEQGHRPGPLRGRTWPGGYHSGASSLSGHSRHGVRAAGGGSPKDPRDAGRLSIRCRRRARGVAVDGPDSRPGRERRRDSARAVARTTWAAAPGDMDARATRDRGPVRSSSATASALGRACRACRLRCRCIRGP